MDHRKYLLIALQLANERRGFCAPNPSVGAVIVDQDRILGQGSHFGSGFEHAEVVASQGLSNLSSSRLYVTLEPCCHWGKTPPCTELIIKKGIKEVYYGFTDPNPDVNGVGEAALRKAGIHCQRIDLPEINAFYQSYAHWTKNKLPWVTAKLAMSIDARIAGPQAEPITITGNEAKQFTYACRFKSDAILTSVKTIINDDPALNACLDSKVIAKPLFVLDSRLELPLNAKVFSTCEKITVFHNAADHSRITALESKGVTCYKVASRNGKLDLREVLRLIGAVGIQDLWVEAGGQIFTSLVKHRWVNTCYLYIAPKLLGSEALPAFASGEGIFSQARSTWSQLGEDLLCEFSW